MIEEQEVTTLPEGQPFEQIVKRLEAERSNRLDLIVNTARNARVIATDDGARLAVRAPEIDVDGEYDITPHAHNQIAAHAGIPRDYYRRMMAEEPELLKANVERWWDRDPALRYVHVRTRLIDGDGRVTQEAWLDDERHRRDFVATAAEYERPFRTRWKASSKPGASRTIDSAALAACTRSAAFQNTRKASSSDRCASTRGEKATSNTAASEAAACFMRCAPDANRR